MSLRDCLYRVLDEWKVAKDTPFKGSPLAGFIREDLVREVAQVSSVSDVNYQIKASPGAGNWANVPWLSIIDPSVTNSTQDGIYPVYLFKADGSGVYLSLNQGTTNPKDSLGKKGAENRAQGIIKYLRKQVSDLKRWNSGQLNLEATTTLGKSYQNPNIGFKYYSITALPSDGVLKSDLLELLTIYKKVAELWPEFSSHKTFATAPESGEFLFDETITVSTKENTNVNISLPKPFLLLAGISGTGKTRFVREQAKASASSFGLQEGDNYCIVPVRPDWHEPSDLLGYVSRINGVRYIATDFLKFMVQALVHAVDKVEGDKICWKTPSGIAPFWLCLDEMNLAPVEQYFADYLSVLESREWKDGNYTCEPMLKPGIFKSLKSTNKEGIDDLSGLAELKEAFFGKTLSDNDIELWGYFLKNGIPLPPNLIVAGTVNMDETTHGFSRKVIDRALTIDFQEFFPNNFDEFFAGQSKPKTFSFPTKSTISQEALIAIDKDKDEKSKSLQFLKQVNDVLEGTPFQLAFRALNELLLAVDCADPKDEKELKAVWDDFLMQKVLPRIEGDSAKLKSIKVYESSDHYSKYLKEEEKSLGKGTLLHDLYNLLESDCFKEIWPEEVKKGDASEGGISKRPDLLRDTQDLIACRSQKKLLWMLKRLKANHFTDFWV